MLSNRIQERRKRAALTAKLEELERLRQLEKEIDKAQMTISPELQLKQPSKSSPMEQTSVSLLSNKSVNKYKLNHQLKSASQQANAASKKSILKQDESSIKTDQNKNLDLREVPDEQKQEHTTSNQKIESKINNRQKLSLGQSALNKNNKGKMKTNGPVNENLNEIRRLEKLVSIQMKDLERIQNDQSLMAQTLRLENEIEKNIERIKQLELDEMKNVEPKNNNTPRLSPKSGNLQKKMFLNANSTQTNESSQVKEQTVSSRIDPVNFYTNKNPNGEEKYVNASKENDKIDQTQKYDDPVKKTSRENSTQSKKNDKIYKTEYNSYAKKIDVLIEENEKHMESNKFSANEVIENQKKLNKEEPIEETNDKIQKYFDTSKEVYRKPVEPFSETETVQHKLDSNNSKQEQNTPNDFKIDENIPKKYDHGDENSLEAKMLEQEIFIKMQKLKSLKKEQNNKALPLNESKKIQEEKIDKYPVKYESDSEYEEVEYIVDEKQLDSTYKKLKRRRFWYDFFVQL